MMPLEDGPEEDKWLKGPYSSPMDRLARRNQCKHEYVDLYNGSGIDKNNDDMTLAWVFCKHCLDKKLLRFDMRQFLKQDDV